MYYAPILTSTKNRWFEYLGRAAYPPRVTYTARIGSTDSTPTNSQTTGTEAASFHPPQLRLIRCHFWTFFFFTVSNATT